MNTNELIALNVDRVGKPVLTVKGETPEGSKVLQATETVLIAAIVTGTLVEIRTYEYGAQRATKTVMAIESLKLIFPMIESK